MKKKEKVYALMLKQASLEHTIIEQRHRIEWLEDYCAKLEMSLDAYMEVVLNAKE